MFIVTYTDYSDNADFHTRLLGTCETREEAESMVAADMAGTAHYYGDSAKIDNAAHEVWQSESEVGRIGCVWDILESED